MTDAGRSSTPDSWNGHKARLKPSGAIHLVEWVRHRGQDWMDDEITASCGREAQRRRFTIHFPPEGRHCPECFPTDDARSQPDG